MIVATTATMTAAAAATMVLPKVHWPSYPAGVATTTTTGKQEARDESINGCDILLSDAGSLTGGPIQIISGSGTNDVDGSVQNQSGASVAKSSGPQQHMI